MNFDDVMGDYNGWWDSNRAYIRDRGLTWHIADRADGVITTTVDGQRYVTGGTSIGEVVRSQTVNGATVLVGAGGEILPLMSGVITVGSGGMYATITEAVASVTEAQMFVPVTPAWKPATVSSWAQGARNVPTSSLSVISFTPPDNLEDLWFKVTGDTRAYPLQSISAWSSAGSAGDSLTSRIPRVDATLGASAAVTFYKEAPLRILLLDHTHVERLTLTTPVSLVIDSLYETAWIDPTAFESVSLMVECAYSHITINKGVTLVSGIGGPSATEGANLLEFIGNKHAAQTSDLHTFENCGAVIFRNCEMHSSPIGGLGHFGLTSNLPGNIEIYGGTFHIHVNRNASAKGAAIPFDSLVCEKFIVDGLSIILDDPNDYIGSVSFVGLTANVSTIHGNGPEVQMSNVTITSIYPSTATISLIDENTGTADDQTARTEKVSLVNCHIASLNMSGTKKLYETHASGSSRVVTAQCCSGGLIDTPSVGSRTITALVS